MGEFQNLNDQNEVPQSSGPSMQERRRLKKEKKLKEKHQMSRKRIMKKVGIWLLSLIVIGGAVFGIIKLGENISPTIPPGQLNNDDQNNFLAIAADDWTKGNPESGVVLIEYSDFQCPACASYFPILEKLAEDEGENFIFVYRHFPLKQTHPKAELAARSAEAAGRQGKFWEMHDLLFENQQEWANSLNTKNKFKEYAQELGIDVQRFEDDIDSGEVKTRVNRNLSEAQLIGLPGTPSFILNGEFIRSPQSLDEFKALIKNAKVK